MLGVRPARRTSITDAGTLHPDLAPRWHPDRPSPSRRAAKNGSGTAIPGSTAAMSRGRRGRRRHRPVAARAAGARLCALQRPIGDRAAAADPRRRGADHRPGGGGSWRRSPTGVARDRRHRLPPVHGEADRLPSLIVDRYGDYLVVQTLSQGTDRLLPRSSRLLVELLQPAGILARNDPRVRAARGARAAGGRAARDGAGRIECARARVALRGRSVGGPEDRPVPRSAREPRGGGAYARGRLLDAFSYNGGFALALAPRCEQVLAVDISEDAVAQIAANATRNGARPTSRRGR